MKYRALTHPLKTAILVAFPLLFGKMSGVAVFAAREIEYGTKFDTFLILRPPKAAAAPVVNVVNRGTVILRDETQQRSLTLLSNVTLRASAPYHQNPCTVLCNPNDFVVVDISLNSWLKRNMYSGPSTLPKQALRSKLSSSIRRIQ